MGKLFWLMLPIVATTVAGILFTALLAANMADLKSAPIVIAIGFVLGTVITFFVAKAIDQARKTR